MLIVLMTCSTANNFFYKSDNSSTANNSSNSNSSTANNSSHSNSSTANNDNSTGKLKFLLLSDWGKGNNELLAPSLFEIL